MAMKKASSINPDSIIRTANDHPPLVEVLPYPDYLTAKQAAAYLQLSTRTIRNLTSRGLLPICRIGGSIRYRKLSIDEALAKQEIKARFDRISRGGAR